MGLAQRAGACGGCGWRCPRWASLTLQCSLPESPSLLRAPAWPPKPAELAGPAACLGSWFSALLRWLPRPGLGTSGYVFWVLPCFRGCCWHLVGQSPGDEGSCNVRDRAVPGGIFLMSCIFRYPFGCSCGWNTCLSWFEPGNKVCCTLKKNCFYSV